MSYLFVFYSATLLAFLVELLKSSVAMQEQMLGGKGFLVIGYLLEKVCLSGSVPHFKNERQNADKDQNLV